MTVEQFRQTPALVIRLREVLADPVALTALEIMRNSNPPIDSALKDDPIVSARLLSQMVGHANYHNTFLSLTEPLRILEPLQAEFKPEQ